MTFTHKSSNHTLYQKQAIYFSKSYILVSFKPLKTQENGDKCKKYKSEN